MATISFHHARAALRGAERKGYKRANLLQAAGINPTLGENPQARINENQMTHLVQSLWRLLGDEFMGFTERPCKQGVFAFMLHTIRNSDTLGDALITGMRFYNLITDDIRTTLMEEQDQAVIQVDFSRPDLDPDGFYLEFWLIIWHRMASWLCGTQIRLLSMNRSTSAPRHALELSYMFPAPHNFESAQDDIRFSADYLELPLIRSKSDINEFLIRSPYDLLTIPGQDHSLRNRIITLVKNPDSDGLIFPPLSEVTDALRLSQRTMHRKLKREATSYQKIKDEIRRDTALNLLTKKRLPVQKVAEILGFSEARSFTRAFKRWTGLSPREYYKNQ